MNFIPYKQRPTAIDVFPFIHSVRKIEIVEISPLPLYAVLIELIENKWFLLGENNTRLQIEGRFSISDIWLANREQLKLNPMNDDFFVIPPSKPEYREEPQ